MKELKSDADAVVVVETLQMHFLQSIIILLFSNEEMTPSGHFDGKLLDEFGT